MTHHWNITHLTVSARSQGTSITPDFGPTSGGTIREPSPEHPRGGVRGGTRFGSPLGGIGARQRGDARSHVDLA